MLYHMILIVWGRWKCLNVALQTGCNFRIWSGYWNFNELFTLSGQIFGMADPCMVGVEMRIKRFNMIMMGGNAGDV